MKHNVAVQVWFASLPKLKQGITGAELTTHYLCSVSGNTTAGTFETCPSAQTDVSSSTSQFYQAFSSTTGVQTNYVHVKASLLPSEVNVAAPGVYTGTVEVRAAKSTI